MKIIIRYVSLSVGIAVIMQFFVMDLHANKSVEGTLEKGFHTALKTNDDVGRVYVETKPNDAQIRILNIKPKFYQGMPLPPGRYHLEVTAAGYLRSHQWIDLSSGENKFSVKLMSSQPAPTRTNSLGMAFVYIKPGSFLMGSPSGETGRNNDEKQHKVTLTKGFYLGKTEVTVGQFRKFVKATGYKTDADKNAGGGDGCYVISQNNDKWEWGHKAGTNWQSPGFKPSDNMPVACVSWNDTQAYIRWLKNKTGESYRLPTEAEWEYAARAGNAITRFWGDDASKACRYANVADQTADVVAWRIKHNCSDGYTFTSPVGIFKPNAFGLYDMLGNVWEWCTDWHAKRYYADGPSTDPKGPSGGTGRVLRGGSWVDGPAGCRSANRGWSGLVFRNSGTGFRLLQEK